jgi:hypothetical protein
LRWLVGMAAAAVLLTGCGTSESDPVGARVLVTTGQGANSVLDRSGVEVTDGESVLALLERVAKVGLSSDGATVLEIDGETANSGHRWTFWVNGVEIRDGALETDGDHPDAQQQETVVTARDAEVHDGDTVWFDLRQDPRVGQPRGVVGTFPEPFVHGYADRSWPVRVECADPRGDACHQVRDELVGYGTPAVTSLLRATESAHTARVSVGTWSEIRVDPAMKLAERGPGTSGVFAKPAPDGRSIELLDPTGKTVETVGPGTGLIFASRYRDEAPSWAVTGTDAAGVRAAIDAWSPDVLHRHYAVAVRDGRVTGLPVAAAER